MPGPLPALDSGATPFSNRLPGWAACLLAPQTQVAAAATRAAIAIEKTIQVTIPSNRSASSEQRDGASQRQSRRPAGPHARSQAGLVFTQAGWGEEGHTILDRDSTTYTGAIATVEKIWPAHLSGSSVPGPGSCPRQGRPKRRRCVDLKSRRPALSRRRADRRSLACSPAPMGVSPETVTQRCSRAKRLREGPPETLAG